MDIYRKVLDPCRPGLAGPANIPAVALTAYTRAEDRRRALLTGFHMHLPKPAEPAELVAAVSNLARMGRTLR